MLQSVAGCAGFHRDFGIDLSPLHQSQPKLAFEEIHGHGVCGHALLHGQLLCPGGLGAQTAHVGTVASICACTTKYVLQVIRAMDRGIASANTMVKYVFLYLAPSAYDHTHSASACCADPRAIFLDCHFAHHSSHSGVPCVAVVSAIITFGIFYVKFKSPYISATTFVSMLGYVLVTIGLTLWRKKCVFTAPFCGVCTLSSKYHSRCFASVIRYRTATNKHDNDYHDKATDCLINFETVKLFGQEEKEIERFTDAVNKHVLALT